MCARCSENPERTLPSNRSTACVVPFSLLVVRLCVARRADLQIGALLLCVRLRETNPAISGSQFWYQGESATRLSHRPQGQARRDVHSDARWGSASRNFLWRWWLRGSQHFGNRHRVGFPGPSFVKKVAAAVRGQAIELCFAIVFRETPLRLQQPLAFKPPKRWIESTFFNEQGIVTLQPDEVRNGITVQGPPDKSLQDEDIQRTAIKLK